MLLRNLVIALLVFQLATLAYADCIGYNDSFTVQALDAKLRPVPGAIVQITFDRGASFGSQYFTTSPQSTDSNGQVSFTIENQGTTSRTIDCNIQANVTIDGETNSTTFVANHHPRNVVLSIPDLYPVRFYLRDQTGAPISGASVSIGDKLGQTDSAGELDYFLRMGSYDFLANYLDASQAGSFNVSDDTQYVLVLTYYKVTVDVTDDTGAPLNATLTIFNQSLTMVNGHYENDKTFGTSIPYTVEYSGLSSDGFIDSANAPNLVVHLDTHAPLFGNITPTVFNGRPRLAINVQDPNQYASGLDLSSISVQYKQEPSDPTTPWNTAVTFTAGRNLFTADFPTLPPNTIVDFRISIKDLAGNRADVSGTFTTFSGTTTSNSTQNQTNTQQPPSQSQGIPLIYIIGGIVIVILAVYLVFRLKSKATGGA